MARQSKGLFATYRGSVAWMQRSAIGEIQGKFPDFIIFHPGQDSLQHL
jgi:hypothetical protein